LPQSPLSSSSFSIPLNSAGSRGDIGSSTRKIRHLRSCASLAPWSYPLESPPGVALSGRPGRSRLPLSVCILRTEESGSFKDSDFFQIPVRSPHFEFWKGCGLDPSPSDAGITRNFFRSVSFRSVFRSSLIFVEFADAASIQPEGLPWFYSLVLILGFEPQCLSIHPEFISDELRLRPKSGPQTWSRTCHRLRLNRLMALAKVSSSQHCNCRSASCRTSFSITCSSGVNTPNTCDAISRTS